MLKTGRKLSLVLAGVTAGALVLAGCSGAGSTGGGGTEGGDNTITALMVGNPQMEDIQKLTDKEIAKVEEVLHAKEHEIKQV